MGKKWYIYGFIYSMDMSLGKPQKTVKDREVLQSRGHKESDRTEPLNNGNCTLYGWEN